MTSSPRNRFRQPLLHGMFALSAAVLAFGLAGCGKNGGKVYFGNLKDGAEVESPFKVEMKAENLVVEPAVNGVKEGHGHFHILVDVDPPMNLDPVPKDPQHIHYGDGQTETTLDLPVGEHMLTLQFAKGDHRPYDPQITQQIKIRVTRRNAPPEETNSSQSGSSSSPADHTDGDTLAPVPPIQVAPSSGAATGM